MLEQYRYIYFLGIGGIGMSALARWFVQHGYWVGGYDRTPTPLTDKLQEEGMHVHFQDTVDNIFEEVRQHPAETLVVLTPAIPKDHRGWAWLHQQGYTIKKRAEVLGMLTQRYFGIGVAGTHGKTTTSSMVAHLLKVCKVPSSAFLGGITVNYNSNLILHQGKEEPAVVVEADEFDRSFLWLRPNLSVVTAVDADHLDIYGEEETLKNSFLDYIGLTAADGKLLISKKAAADLGDRLNSKAEVWRYGLEDDSLEVYADNIRIEGNRFYFDYHAPDRVIKGLELAVPGFHNVENALAALAIAQLMGCSAEALKEAMASYRGVRRRFEYILEKPDFIFIDDYAHHPEEIKAFLKSVRALYPDKKISVVFQPHLYSRTRDFAQGFGEALSLANEVILTNIYPARELPVPGVSSELIFKHISCQEKKMIELSALPDLVRKTKFEVLCTLGAGDIDRMVGKVKEIVTAGNELA